MTCFFCLFLFIIKHTVAIPFKVRVLDLFAKVLTHTFCVLILLADTRAIATGSFESLFDGFNDLCVFIEPNLHCQPSRSARISSFSW